MAVGAIETCNQYMAFMIETPLVKAHRLALDTHMTAQTHVLGQPWPEVNCRNRAGQLADIDCFAHQIRRRPQQLVGKRYVVCSLSNPDELHILLCLLDQAIGHRARPHQSRANCCSRRSHDVLHVTQFAIHLALPGQQNVGIADAVTRQACGLPRSLHLFVARHVPADSHPQETRPLG